MLAVLAVLAAAVAPFIATAQGRPVADGRPLLLSAEAVLLLDPEGKTLFAKNPDEERAPASLVKLMTLYLAFEDIEGGKADLDELVTISRYAALTPRSRMGLRAGESVPLHVLLEGVAIASANDAATALAERLGGDEWSFVSRMNAKAQELEAKQRLRRQTDDAIAAGVFGVPSAIVEGELFWGFDDLPHLELYLRGEDPLVSLAIPAERVSASAKRRRFRDR